MSLGSDIITKVRERIEDIDDQSFDDTILLSFINDGATEFAATTGVIQDTVTIDTANDYIFDLVSPLTNHINVFAVQYALVPLDWMTQAEVSTQLGVSTGTPTAWTVWGDKLYLDIKATTASGVNALTVYYTRTPTNMTATSDTLDFPARWEPAIVAYAAYRAHDSNRESGLADRQRAEFDSMRQAASGISNAQIQSSGYSR